MISSYVGENKEFERQYLAGELELEFTPRARWPRSCAPAARAFPPSSPAPASGTIVAEGKELREFDGQTYVMERSLVPRGGAGQGHGPTSRQPAFRPDGATSTRPRHGRARSAWWKWSEIVEPARWRPDERAPARHLRAPHRAQPTPEKRIEKTHHHREGDNHGLDPRPDGARGPKNCRTALRQPRHRHSHAGGQPCAGHIEKSGCNRKRHAGHRPLPTEDEVDADLINAGKQTVTTLKGSSIFGSHDSFAMIRGGKINLSILGAMQVTERATWPTG